LQLPPETLRATARTDVNFFRRIVSNLISNSIKYSDFGKPEGARVEVVLQVLATRLCLEVSDNGIGIAQEIIDNGQIFQPFFQVNNTQSQGDKGVGLGLTIVNALTTLLPNHGLSIRSEIGRGSTFCLEMPFSAASLPELAEESVQAMDVGSLAGTYVVLVEDDELVRQSMVRLLTMIGIRCDAYDSFEQIDRSLPGMERIPDVVLSDFRLPNGRSAIDVREAIGEFAENLPFVVFSGEAMDLSTLPALQGVPVLRKPLAVEILVQTLREVVRPAVQIEASPASAGGA
jgi:CheY-like chemotaxis protein